MHRKTNQAGIDLIKKYEGFSPTTYICPAGYATIGYGHLVKKGEIFSDIIDEAIAEQILCQDLEIAEKTVIRNVKVIITDNQFAALVSFVFNLGGGALQSSTLLRKLNEGMYYEASLEFSRWVYAGGRKLRGLVRRRQEEALLFLAKKT